MSPSCWAAISSSSSLLMLVIETCVVIEDRLYASFTLQWVYIGRPLDVARFLITTLGRARDAAIVCWMSAISLYSVHRSCDRLVLRRAIVSLWGESDAIE